MTQTSTKGSPTAMATAAPSNTDEIDIDVRGLLMMLWRRKMVILSLVLMGLAVAVLAISVIKSEYTARALVLVETSKNQQTLTQIQAALRSSQLSSLDTSLILSEIEVLKSRSLAHKVVKRLNLLADPEFNPRFKYHNAASKENNHSFKKLSVYGSEIEKLPSETTNREIGTVITGFIGKLSVRSVAGSNAIQVDFTSTDPGKAALIANTIVDIYIEQQLERKFAATKKVTDWLDKRLTSLREQVRSADKQVAEYKEKYNITQGARKVTMSTEQLSALNSQLVVARAKKAEAQAKLDQIKNLKNPKNIETTAEIVDSRLIQGLKQEKSKLETALSDLSSRYGKKHPKIIEIKSEIRKIRQNISEEMNKIAKSVENEVIFADARVQELEKGLSEYQGQQHEDNESMIGLYELEREAESTRLIYDTFLQTYKRSDEQEELQEAEAKVLSYASTPNKPSYPNKLLLLSLSATISLFLGLALSIILEKLDNTFRSAGQLEKSMGFPCYALIPNVGKTKQTELVNYITSKPSSTVAESVRTLRTVLKLRPTTSGNKPRCVTITSSFPGEGKTTLSIWLARMAAKSGEKVIVIDGDLRRPNIHRSVGRSNDTSLVDYLTGNKELEEVIQKDESSGAYMIYGRSVPNSALDLVSTDKMEKLVESLKQAYDLVIIDSPACLAVSDARVLANFADQLVYAVGWDDTPREVVMSGVKQFSDMGYENIAFVLSNVDVKRHAKYGYGDTAYYYGRYQEYYKN